MLRVLQSLLTVLGALAVLMVGALPATGAERPSPCHEAPAVHHGEKAPPDGKARVVKAMACCAICVAATAPLSGDEDEAMTSVVRLAPRPGIALSGLTPAPGHGPPRR